MTPTRYVMVLESDAHDDGVQYVAPSLERAVEFVRTVLTIAQPGDGFDLHMHVIGAVEIERVDA
jgi:hypothetical protein